MFTTKLLLAPVCPVKKMPQIRKCEVTFPYNPVNHDELQLKVGEIVEIVREVESHSPLLKTTFRPEVYFMVCLVFLGMYVCCIFLTVLLCFFLPGLLHIIYSTD